MSRAAWLRERLRRESPLVAPRCALLEAGRRFEPELPPDARCAGGSPYSLRT